jgi:3-dehydroquinate synthase
MVIVGPPGGRYAVHVGAGASRRLPGILAAREGISRAHLVLDARVARIHGQRVKALARKAGVPISATTVPAGERSKSVRQLARLWREIVSAGCDRDSVVVAVGGGVVGDLAGFAAASIYRGIDLVQVPTTLLAMVDASVGGKTGINIPQGKNLAGAFHQPIAVVMDLDFLRTLPPREAGAGWAEVIKTAAIRDAGLLETLERKRTALRGMEALAVLPVVEACSRIKAAVVAEDEREAGIRRILNFGHTLAHALEAATRYGSLLHGEAVAIGMVFAARLGESLGRTERGTAARLENLLRDYELPTRPPRGISAARVLGAMDLDKKRGPGGLRWVLLARPGEVIITDGIDRSLVQAKLGEFLKTGD